ncbi:DUF6519 domain-containing protein [Actinopolymorpha pittospori]
MHADLTRWTFDPTQGYRSVLMQQGRVLLDAEWNEQTAIDAHHDEVRTADIVGAEGGPAPLDGSAGPFAILDSGTGLPPVNTAWANLAVTGGRYYVDGVLVEESAATSPLADQPFLELTEPATGRWAVYLDVSDRLVTADERPELLESALGGPDTAFRTQTVWQVRLATAAAGEVCSDVADTGERTPRQMRVRLQDSRAADDPCSITSDGGYTRLENQLYRVEVHDIAAGTPQFVWSRENGSVVAGLDELDDSPINGTLAQLTVDRTGRDDELSIGQGSWVEVTSPERQVRGLPGWIARVTDLFDTELHVVWSAGHPASLAAVGATPIVRRWESAPKPVSVTYAALEGGIEVSFPTGGDIAIGDYWLIPARTSRLAYGVVATHGTIEWPWSPDGNVALPPLGPAHHTAPLAVLDHTASGWTAVGDCRNLFPPLTEIITIDLVGGDGQEAMPGDQLDEPVRVAVRNGSLPVADARVEFIASDGGQLTATTPPAGPASTVVARTSDEGVAEVRWTLAPAGPPTQTVTAHRLDDHGNTIDVDVIVTGRLSVASQVAWTPPCEGFAGSGDVQKALVKLATTQSIRLLGGDGQEVDAEGRTVPRLVRVAVDSPCGPLRRATVVATASDGALVLPLPDGDPVPATLTGNPDAKAEVDGTTNAGGVAAFAWQPVFDTATSDVLKVGLPDSDEATIQVSSQLDPPGSRTAGIHVTAIKFFTGKELLNDEVYGFDELGGNFPGIAVQLDLPVDQASVQGKPVVRLLLELPWPVRPEFQPFGSATSVWARRTIEIVGQANADGPLIIWTPGRPNDDFDLDGVLHQVVEAVRKIPAHTLFEPPLPLRMRFQIDGWAISGDPREGLERLHVNGHTDTFVDDKGKTRLELPSTDEVTGGRFDTWFWFTDETPQRPNGPIVRGRLDLAAFPDAVVNVLRPMIEAPVLTSPRRPQEQVGNP